MGHKGGLPWSGLNQTIDLNSTVITRALRLQWSGVTCPECWNLGPNTLHIYQFTIKQLINTESEGALSTNKFSVYSLFQRAKFSSEASIKLEASSFNSGLSFGKF